MGEKTVTLTIRVRPWTHERFRKLFNREKERGYFTNADEFVNYLLDLYEKYKDRTKRVIDILRSL